jgi:hypothetical protein
MTNNKLTNERIEQYANDPLMCNVNDEIREMARELQEYRKAAHAVNYQQLSELYHAQEKRLFKLAQRIKGQAFDKYAYSPSQAIDVLESAVFGESEDLSHAAIRPAPAVEAVITDNSALITDNQSAPAVVPEWHSSVIAEQLAHVLSGMEVTDHQRAIISCAVDRLNKNAAMLQLFGNSEHVSNRDELPGWIKCSERMPEDSQWCAVNTDYGYYVQCWSDGQGWLGDEVSIPNCDVTHWMPLPAAPQQEPQ